MSKKQALILIILLLAAGAVVFYLMTNKKETPVGTGQSLSPSASAASTASQVVAATGEREIIMEDVAQTIADISPVKPVLGGHWFVDRFWFVSGSDSDFYVEYEDGHNLRRVLLNAQEKETGLSYAVVAYFEPGESDWTLKSGTDTILGKNLDLYEFNDSLKSWVKKN